MNLVRKCYCHTRNFSMTEGLFFSLPVKAAVFPKQLFTLPRSAAVWVHTWRCSEWMSIRVMRVPGSLLSSVKADIVQSEASPGWVTQELASHIPHRVKTESVNIPYSPLCKFHDVIPHTGPTRMILQLQGAPGSATVDPVLQCVLQLSLGSLVKQRLLENR